MLSSHTILSLGALVPLIYPCVAADRSTELIDRLKNLRPLAPIEPDFKRQVIASLPTEGEVKALSKGQREKLQAVVPALKLHRRNMDYVFKVVESPQARVAIHARFVVLVTDTALRLLTPTQFQALVAHEIGHEYVWAEYEDARNRNDWPRLRELELFCDAVAVKTLVATGAAPAELINALRIIVASNERNGFITDPSRDSHPSLVERSRVSKDLAERLSALPLAAKCGR